MGLSASQGRSPYMTSLEAAEYTRKPNRKAFRMWAQRQGLVPRRAGRVLLFDRREVDMALEGRRWPGGHGSTVGARSRRRYGNAAAEPSASEASRVVPGASASPGGLLHVEQERV